MTPEYLREARAYLSLTHQVQEPASPASPCSPGVSSPILSSTGLALGERGGRRREVRFEDNIMSESAWDRRSTSSDSSLDHPVVLPRPGMSGSRTSGMCRAAFRASVSLSSSPTQVLVNYHAFQRLGVRIEGGLPARQTRADTIDGRMRRLCRHTTADPAIKINATNQRRLHVVICFVTSTLVLTLFPRLAL